jgi:hypothetical protein
LDCWTDAGAPAQEHRFGFRRGSALRHLEGPSFFFSLYGDGASRAGAQADTPPPARQGWRGSDTVIRVLWSFGRHARTGKKLRDFIAAVKGHVQASGRSTSARLHLRPPSHLCRIVHDVAQSAHVRSLESVSPAPKPAELKSLGATHRGLMIVAAAFDQFE